MVIQKVEESVFGTPVAGVEIKLSFDEAQALSEAMHAGVYHLPTGRSASSRELKGMELVRRIIGFVREVKC